MAIALTKLSARLMLMYQAKTKKDTVVTDGHESVVGEPQKQEILIVDDSNINREILSEMLGNEYIYMRRQAARSVLTCLVSMALEFHLCFFRYNHARNGRI